MYTSKSIRELPAANSNNPGGRCVHRGAPSSWGAHLRIGG
uniref:Uncharacterized protein n=1 Tax=Arundo donax TaxID=35708 RepID=A0A0A8YFY4_ARUDO